MTDGPAADASSEHRLGLQIDGYRAGAIVYAAARLGLPDLMASGNATAGQLAAETGLAAAKLHRLLRALAAIGVCEEHPDGTFRLSESGRLLQSTSPSGLREKAILAVEQYWPAWANLEHCLRGERTGFEQVFGMTPWAFRRSHPESGALFDSWLGKETASAAASIVEAIDFSGVGRVADIGGGNGSLLASALRSDPRLAGVLFDRQQVIRQAGAFLESAGLAHRVELIGGDFFSRIAVQADLFLLKSVLHDWDDDRARRILRNCRAAMSSRSRLLVIERVLPERAAQQAETTMIDMHMMAVTGGRERSRAELDALLRKEDLAVAGACVAACGFTILEVLPS